MVKLGFILTVIATDSALCTLWFSHHGSVHPRLDKGYPSHSNFGILDLLHLTRGILNRNNYTLLVPQKSLCGLFLSCPGSWYHLLEPHIIVLQYLVGYLISGGGRRSPQNLLFDVTSVWTIGVGKKRKKKKEDKSTNKCIAASKQSKTTGLT